MVSLESSISKAVFQGNGATVEFPFAFTVWNATEIKVQVTGPDGVIQDVTAQCSVMLSESGGTVTYAPGGTPLPSGYTLVILRNMPFLQDVKLITGTRFDPAVIEEALDRATAERQQLLEKVDRAVVVPADSANPPEELADQLFEAKDQAEAAAGEAADYGAEARTQADRAESEADRARDEADRAAQAAQLGAGAANLEAVWTLAEAVAAGESLDLPVVYFPGRNMLHLSYDGVELYRGPQYEEIGEPGADVRSSAVRMRIPLGRGTVMRAWAVASNVARHVEEAEERAGEQADRAEAEADRAASVVRDAVADAVSRTEDAANRAEAAADEADTARKVAQNAAQEATEQADRADDAAVDAGRYRAEAMEAAKCAAASAQGRSLAAVQSPELLDRVPSGFFVVNGELVLPGTIQHPLTPVDSVEAIPNMDGFFLLAPPFPDCPDPEPGPDEPDEPGGDDWALTLPCGKRVKFV